MKKILDYSLMIIFLSINIIAVVIVQIKPIDWHLPTILLSLSGIPFLIDTYINRKNDKQLYKVLAVLLLFVLVSLTIGLANNEYVTYDKDGISHTVTDLRLSLEKTNIIFLIPFIIQTLSFFILINKTRILSYLIFLPILIMPIMVLLIVGLSPVFSEYFIIVTVSYCIFISLSIFLYRINGLYKATFNKIEKSVI